MKTVAAYLLCVLGGNANPSSDDVSKVITATGGEADASKITSLIAELKGKNIGEIIDEGKKRLATVSLGGGGGSGPAGATKEVAAAVVEEPEEEEEEIDMGGGMDMFGGGEAGGGDY